MRAGRYVTERVSRVGARDDIVRVTGRPTIKSGTRVHTRHLICHMRRMAAGTEISAWMCWVSAWRGDRPARPFNGWRGCTCCAASTCIGTGHDPRSLAARRMGVARDDRYGAQHIYNAIEAVSCLTEERSRELVRGIFICRRGRDDTPATIGMDVVGLMAEIFMSPFVAQPEGELLIIAHGSGNIEHNPSARVSNTSLVGLSGHNAEHRVSVANQLDDDAIDLGVECSPTLQLNFARPLEEALDFLALPLPRRHRLGDHDGCCRHEERGDHDHSTHKSDLSHHPPVSHSAVVAVHAAKCSTHPRPA